MKKFVAVMTAAAMLTSLSACGASASTASSAAESTASSAAADSTTGSTADATTYKVAIVQQLDHASLDEIRTAILAEIDRGVTVLHGEGGYTGEPSEVLLSVISNRELPRLEKLVHSIDPACFLIVSRVTEVSGRGFSMEKEYQ